MHYLNGQSNNKVLHFLFNEKVVICSVDSHNAVVIEYEVPFLVACAPPCGRA